MPPIPLPINSSAIAEAIYDDDFEELLIVFTDGSAFLYPVDPITVATFMSASSQGAYFNEHIRPLGGTPL